MVHEAHADEADLFDTLLAGERVCELLDTACTSSVPPAARLAATKELRELLATQPEALEEAQAADAASRLSQAADSCPLLVSDALALRTLLAATPQHTVTTSFSLPRQAGTLQLFTLVGRSAVLGGRLWASAQLLVTHILAQEDLAGANVLELGAGAGLAGLAALHLGAGTVTLSDTPSAPELLELLAKNAAANPHPGTGAVAHVLPLDWADDGGAAAEFDMVVGSDVLYHEELAQPLARTMAAHLKPGGTAHLVCPVRSASILDACVGHARALGLASTRRVLDHQEGHNYSFEHIQLQWMPR
jgi:predicted nicotinamide N-methyase